MTPIKALIYMILGCPLFMGTLLAVGGDRSEAFVARCSLWGIRCYTVLVTLFIMMWIGNGAHSIDIRAFTLFRSGEYELPLAFWVDCFGIVYVGLIAFLGSIVISFSRFYMHKEFGYQRFFACLQFFIFGLTLLALSGTLDLLMAGWEFVGVSSFFLIGFYQHRLSPVRNAFKVLSVYKFCDIGLLLSAWLSHLLWHETQFFSVLSTIHARSSLAQAAPWQMGLMSAMILFAAAGKSAQWPFSFWLSKAVEGPTPSSAIFYGALSVHAGVVLLHRTQPIWSSMALGPWMIGGLGLLTAFVCTGVSRAQSNVKGQIAYSSAANVGLIFVELALGLNSVAILHLVANACLRCYQLLVSPSAFITLLRYQNQSGGPVLGQRSLIDALIKKLPPCMVRGWYVYCVNEGYLEAITRFLFWRPFVRLGIFLNCYDRIMYWWMLPATLISLLVLNWNLHPTYRVLLAMIASLFTMALSIMGLAELKSAVRAWNTISASVAMVGVTILLVDPGTYGDVLIYWSGLLFFWVIGLQSLVFMRGKAKTLSLRGYRGISLISNGGAVMLLVAMLGVSGFPISPTFIGQDLMLHHASEHYIGLVFLMSLTMALSGIGFARVYVRTCMGPLNLKNP